MSKKEKTKTSAHNTGVFSTDSWSQFPSVFAQYHDFPDYQDYDYDYDDTRSSLTGLLNYYGLGSLPSIKEELQSVEKEAYCFNSIEFSKKFVDSILKEAVRKLQLLQESRAFGLMKSIEITKATSQKFQEHRYSENRDDKHGKANSVKWPRVSEFNIKLGQEKLEIFVSQWERSDDWMFCVDFLGFESEDCSNIFVYEVEWSKPTMSYPIPQATASVYFGLDVSKIIPYNYDRPVQVYYVFECSNVIHTPERTDFQEIWLQNILDAKLKFFRTITFSGFDLPTPILKWTLYPLHKSVLIKT